MSDHHTQQTSLFAYQGIVHGELGSRQAAVLDAIEQATPRGICNREIAEALHLPINSVTPRVHELRSKGRVEADRTGRDPATGRTVIFWKVAA